MVPKKTKKLRGLYVSFLNKVIESIVVFNHLFDDFSDCVTGQKKEVHDEHWPEHIDLQKLETSADRSHDKCISDSLPDLNFAH